MACSAAGESLDPSPTPPPRLLATDPPVDTPLPEASAHLSNVTITPDSGVGPFIITVSYYPGEVPAGIMCSYPNENGDMVSKTIGQTSVAAGGRPYPESNFCHDFFVSDDGTYSITNRLRNDIFCTVRRRCYFACCIRVLLFFNQRVASQMPPTRITTPSRKPPKNPYWLQIMMTITIDAVTSSTALMI